MNASESMDNALLDYNFHVKKVCLIRELWLAEKLPANEIVALVNCVSLSREWHVICWLAGWLTCTTEGRSFAPSLSFGFHLLVGKGDDKLYHVALPYLNISHKIQIIMRNERPDTKQRIGRRSCSLSYWNMSIKLMCYGYVRFVFNLTYYYHRLICVNLQ